MAKSWSKKPEDVPVEKLRKASIASYKNACELLEDSQILLAGTRYARSVVMSILSEEEFAKAFFLHSCAFQPRWDSAIWKALISHGGKQALPEAMRQFMPIIEKKIIDVLNKASFISTPYKDFMTEDVVNEISDPLIESHIKNKQIDKIKQSKIYVSISRDGDIESLPSSNKEEATGHLQQAEEFKSILERAYGEIGVIYA